jgi:hypothetical protein
VKKQSTAAQRLHISLKSNGNVDVLSLTAGFVADARHCSNPTKRAIDWCRPDVESLEWNRRHESGVTTLRDVLLRGILSDGLLYGRQRVRAPIRWIDFIGRWFVSRIDFVVSIRDIHLGKRVTVKRGLCLRYWSVG